MARIELLDCTLRDGGFLLEDLFLSRGIKLHFKKTFIDKFIIAMISSNMNYLEIGSIENIDEDQIHFTKFKSVLNAEKNLLSNKNKRQITIALMLKGPEIELSKFPDPRTSKIGLIRVIIRYSELQKSIEYCEKLAHLGWSIAIQPMATQRYKVKELKMLIDLANKIKANSLYIVDSYGNFDQKSILGIFNLYDSLLNKSIRIGLHLHNNNQLAYSNVIRILGQKTPRRLIIDGSIMGMGLGSGNLQTEVITNHINKFHRGKVNFGYILDACELLSPLWKKQVWGYSTEMFIPTINKIAYKYASALRFNYSLSYRDIYENLNKLDEGKIHQYTEENLISLMNDYEIS